MNTPPLANLLKTFPDGSVEYKSILNALNENQKLEKTLTQIIKRSDHFERELRKVTHELNDKNNFLELLTNQLSKYLSPQLFNSIFESDGVAKVGTKRKKLTIFFSDISRFTTISEQSEPETLTFFLNDYLKEMSSIAMAHGATIDKFIGDAIMIFFGDPETLGEKEDALKCTKMAIEMQRKMIELRIKWAKMGFSQPFRIKIGINTGFCNVGNFGFENRMEYTIIGGAVNLASRLEQLSDVDGILISQETHAFVEDEIVCEPRKLMDIKGVGRKVKTFAVNKMRTHADGATINSLLIKNPLINYENLSLTQKQDLKYELMKVIDKLDE
jgi:class 3 adenylate cyclase